MRRPDLETTDLKRTIQTGNFLMTLGFLTIYYGTADAWSFHNSNNIEYNRRYPLPIADNQAQVAKQQIDVLDRSIALYKHIGIIPPVEIERSLANHKRDSNVYKEQLEFKAALQTSPRAIDRLIGELGIITFGLGFTLMGRWLRQDAYRQLEEVD